jgi:hypothetical protein
MKQSVQMDIIQGNMRPGVITRDGFLGTDRRKLVEILVEDDEHVKRIGYTHQQIARRMQEFRDAGVRGLGSIVPVEPHFEVTVDSVRGGLPCPFGHPGIIPKTNITVKNLEKGTEITYTELNVHMIGAHGFYEGKGAELRLEPKDLVEVLEIVPFDTGAGF